MAAFGNPAIAIVSIVFGSVIVIVALIAWVVVSLIKRSGRGSGDRMTNAEMQLVQEIHASLAEMEKRIDSLETILLGHGKGK